ncbi:MAG: nitroreductase family protein [Anaerolineae bacterium]|jgi:nitroreductase|nr:nitroreductase family protein [Anaerolineae bacterium]
MNVLDLIFSRRSVRKYKDQPVSREQLTDLLKAGMAAPSACNNQPWEFVAVDDPAVMEELRGSLRNGPYNAPAAIITLYNDKIGNNVNCNGFWQQDLSAATENIMIAAAGMELGTVWLGTYPKEDTVAKVQKILGIPENIIPLVVIYVGTPESQPEPSTKFDEERVHWNQY